MSVTRQGKGSLAAVLRVGVAAAVFALGVLPFAPAYAETITIAGATIPLDEVLRPVQPGFEKGAGSKIRLVDRVFTETYEDLVSGKVDAYVTTLPFDDVIQDLKNQGTVLGTEMMNELRVTELARVPLAVFVNKDNPLYKITAEQLGSVLSGKVENWNALTGNNRTIRTLMLPGYKVPLRYQFLGGGELGPQVFLRETVREIAQEAIAYPNVLAILPASAYPSSLRKIPGPDMARIAILVTKGEPSEKIKKLIEFVRGEGRTFLKMK